MKVVHISFSDKRGGAAIAASRLNEAMQSDGINSCMLVLDRQSTEPSVVRVGDGKKRAFAQIFSALEDVYLKRKYMPFGTFSLANFGFNLFANREVQEADVIYLHWVNAGLLSLNGIRKILSLNKPVIWFLHDMWPMTGGCHHSFDCEQYKTHCYKCPNLSSSVKKDISFSAFKKKMRVLLPYSNLFIITPSIWLGECAKESFLFKDRKITVIPNTINVAVFKSIEKTLAREILNLPQDKRLILFGADTGVNNPYKGWSFLCNALQYISVENTEVVVFGNKLNVEQEKVIPFSVHSMGRLEDNYSLVLLYSAVDVFVTPSLAESFGQTTIEAQACGTMVVGFNIGGIPDLIKHMDTGYLANYKDEKDLASGIEWALQQGDNKNLLKQLRCWVVNNFSYRSVVKKHREMLINIVANDL